MAVNVPSASYLQQIGADIVALRNALQKLINHNAYVTAMGGASFLEAAPFSLSSGDAAAVVAALGNLGNNSTFNQAMTDSQTMWGGN